MSAIRYCTAFFLFAFLTACGGGGGGGDSVGVAESAPTNPQLSSTVIDLSAYQNTFADTTKIGGTEIAGSFSDQIFAALKKLKIIGGAYAEQNNTCNDNVVPIGVDLSQRGLKYKKIKLIDGITDRACYLSSQEAGGYIFIQAKNAYRASKKCDLLAVPVIGGTVSCLEVNIKKELITSAGSPIFRFNEDLFGGTGSKKSLAGKITQNGKYFFVAFNSDPTKNGRDIYDGIYRIDLTGANPTGKIVYLIDPIKLDSGSKKWSFAGYVPLESGDLVTWAYEINKTPLNEFVYFVQSNENISDPANQIRTLVDTSDTQGTGDFVNSPLFSWLKSQYPAATTGSTLGAYFSSPQSEKSFFTIPTIDGVTGFSGNTNLLIKVTLTASGLEFSNYGRISLSNGDSLYVDDNLENLYEVVTGTNPVQIIKRPLSVDAAESTVTTNISVPSDYTQHFVKNTKNYIFISSHKTSFWNEGNPMDYKMHSIAKLTGSGSWFDAPTTFSAVDLGNYEDPIYKIRSMVPSLAYDRLFVVLKNSLTESIFAMDMLPTRLTNVVEITDQNAVKTNFAVVSKK